MRIHRCSLTVRTFASVDAPYASPNQTSSCYLAAGPSPHRPKQNARLYLETARSVLGFWPEGSYDKYACLFSDMQRWQPKKSILHYPATRMTNIPDSSHACKFDNQICLIIPIDVYITIIALSYSPIGNHHKIYRLFNWKQPISKECKQLSVAVTVKFLQLNDVKFVMKWNHKISTPKMMI